MPPKPESLSQIVDHCISIANANNFTHVDIAKHCSIGNVSASAILQGKFADLQFSVVNRFVAGMLGKLPKKMF